jgi:RNA polymerase sigma-70 factor (ECF subfamily)
VTVRHQGLDAESFEALVRDCTPQLYRFALSLTRRPDAAEDLVQEAFLRAWRQRGTFRGDANPAGWLHRILHNAAIDRLRRERHELLVADVEEAWRDDAYTVDSQAVIERAQDREELEDALVRLPFIYRSAVVLHDVQEMTTREIADVLHIGEPAVKQRLRRGRMMLVSALAQSAARQAALKGVPMRCWDARRLVSDYLNHTLAAEDRTMVEAHMARCPTCPPLYASLVGVRETLSVLRDPDSVVPPDLAERIAATERA